MKKSPDGLDADRLVKDYDNLARKIASKYAGVVEFDDLYQIARMAIWESPKTFDVQRGSLNTHLYKSALYAVLEHVKNEQGGAIRLPGDTGQNRDNPRGPRPKCVTGLVLDEEPLSEDNAIETVERKTALTSLCQSAALTTKQANVIRMLFVEGMTFGEVVIKLGCTEQNLHYLRKTALDKIREVARTQGVEPEDLLS